MSAHPDTPSAHSRKRRILPLVVIGVAVAMQLVVAVPFTLGLGLLAPPWGIVAGWVLWLVGAGALAMTARRRPLLTPLVPIANAALLVALLTFGDWALGWTA